MYTMGRKPYSINFNMIIYKKIYIIRIIILELQCRFFLSTVFQDGFTILVTGDENIYIQNSEYLHSQPTTGVMRVRSM